MGKSFLSMLPRREDFLHFVERSMQSDEESSSHRAPPCYRVHLQNTSGRSVALDVLHVKVPKLFGAKEPYHLLVLKEDVEPRECPGQTEEASRSIESSGERLESCEELVEVKLLLDGMSEHFDILEAQMKFKRPFEAETWSQMPHLQNFTRPQDWKSIYRQLSQFIWTCYSTRTAPDPCRMAPVSFRPQLLPASAPAPAAEFLRAWQSEVSLASELFSTEGTQPLRLFLCLRSLAEI